MHLEGDGATRALEILQDKPGKLKPKVLSM